MRQHRGGGRSNQREAEAVVREAVEQFCHDIPEDRIGVITPYRRQVEKLKDVLEENRIDAGVDTVHQYQGRQCDAVILSTVLDETWKGQTGLGFVDDPHLINVAVSRAAKRFIVVSNHDMLPRSRHVRDLIDYIAYQNPDQPYEESSIASIFDLLYKEYSDRLADLASRVNRGWRYLSESIAWTTLQDILSEEQYVHLTAIHEVLLRNLFTDLSEMNERQQLYVRRRASVDFVVYNRVTNRPCLAIEVDGFASHENNPAQLERDKVKDQIFAAHDFPLLRLPTTGSDEERKIREALDSAAATVVDG